MLRDPRIVEARTAERRAPDGRHDPPLDEDNPDDVVTCSRTPPRNAIRSRGRSPSLAAGSACRAVRDHEVVYAAPAVLPIPGSRRARRGDWARGPAILSSGAHCPPPGGTTAPPARHAEGVLLALSGDPRGLFAGVPPWHLTLASLISTSPLGVLFAAIASPRPVLIPSGAFDVFDGASRVCVAKRVDTGRSWIGARSRVDMICLLLVRSLAGGQGLEAAHARHPHVALMVTTYERRRNRRAS